MSGAHGYLCERCGAVHQARATLSDLADQAKAGAEKIITKNGESYVALIDAASAWTTTTAWSASASTCC
jgi:antitoxin (DNA-binding transcriptional repressor) of toxin-antitoxin stability system